MEAFRATTRAMGRGAGASRQGKKGTEGGSEEMRREKGKAPARSLRTQEKRQSAQKEGEKQLGEGNDGMSGDAAERETRAARGALLI